MFLTATCLLHALIGVLIGKGVLSPSDAAEIADDAEEFLAGLNPGLMSPEAREHARAALQQGGSIFE